MSSSTARNNYKAKWLAALKESEQTPTERSSNIENTSQSIVNTSANASISINKIQHAAMETAAQAKKTIQTLVDHRITAGIDFGDVTHGIDNKLSSMPIPIMMRRIRDILLMCEMRIGILSISADESHRELVRSHERVTSLQRSLEPLQSSITNAAWIGVNPTASEFEDFQASGTNEYHRYGIEYEDLTEDWFDMQITADYTLRQKGVEDPSSSKNKQGNSRNERAIVPRENRTAAVIPNGYRSKNNDLEL